MGPSGSGKSSLLYILGALEPPTSGTVTLDGRNPFQLPAAQLAAFRNESVGFVFQDHCLLPQCTVLENVLIPTLVATGRGDGDADARAPRSIEQVGLGDRIDHRPGELSGGERQRVAIARALIRAAAAAALRRADRQPRSRLRRQRRVAAARSAPASSRRSSSSSRTAPQLAERFPIRFELVDRQLQRVIVDGGIRTSHDDTTRDLLILPQPVALLLAHEPRGRARRRDRGRGARRCAAGRRLGARQPARSRARSGSAAPIAWSCPPGSSARRSPTTSRRDGVPDFAGARPADCRRGRGQRSGQRPARRRACRSTASTIGSGGFTASPACAARRAATALVSPALASRHRRGRRQRRRSSGSSGRPAIPIESLHGRKDDAGRTLRLDRRRGPRRRPTSASSRCGRSRVTVRAVFVPLGAPAAGPRDLRRPRQHAAGVERGQPSAATNAAARGAGPRSASRSTTSGLIAACRGRTRVAVESAAGLIDARARDGGRRRGSEQRRAAAAGPHLSRQQRCGAAIARSRTRS